LLFALPLLAEDSEIRLSTPLQSAPYVDLTMEVMARFGVGVTHEQYGRFFIAGGQTYSPASLTIESDYSPAAFFLAASALGRPCECRGLSPDSRQGDRRILDILSQSGIRLKNTPEGGMIAQGENLYPQTVDVSDIPDLVPPLAVLFCFCAGTSRLINAGRLRLKESDRLLAVTDALNALGGQVTIAEDTLIIHGVPSLAGGIMDSCGDHRIAMMGAVAAIRSQGPVWVQGYQSVAKSYPDFWQDFGQIR
jgi:3-phosphoshikimate 1-carboxyvinyltransferase